MSSKIEEGLMLEEIRKLLGLTIERFVFEMDWPNIKYYDYIKNGRKRSKTGEKVQSRPTINKVFSGINKAIDTYPHWNKNAVEITYIVIRHLKLKLK